MSVHTHDPETTRRCRCGAEICDGCVLYRGSRTPDYPEQRGKCSACDYRDYLNSPGGM